MAQPQAGNVQTPRLGGERWVEGSPVGAQSTVFPVWADTRVHVRAGACTQLIQRVGGPPARVGEEGEGRGLTPELGEIA